MSAVAEWFVLRLATAAEIDGWKLIFLILFAFMVEEFCPASDFVRTVFECFNSYSHDFLLCSYRCENECNEIYRAKTARRKGRNAFFSLRFADFSLGAVYPIQVGAVAGEVGDVIVERYEENQFARSRYVRDRRCHLR
jgi:hypothetical protein